MGDVVNFNAYKCVDNAIDVAVTRIAKELYFKCKDTLKTVDDCYTYIDVDIDELIDSVIVDFKLTKELNTNLESLMQKELIDNGVTDIDSIDLLLALVEDCLNGLLFGDGYTLCFKVPDTDDILVLKDTLLSLNREDVLDRILYRVLDSIPYELIYIK